MWKIYMLSQILVCAVLSDDQECLRTFCKCNQHNRLAKCSGLSYIPKIPKYVRILNLTGNYLPYITKGIFRNISKNYIQNLMLKNNSIVNLTEDAFKDLEHLKRLDIKQERKIDITSLQGSFKSVNKSVIRELRLEENEWKDLPMDFFSYLTGANISTISLDGNQLNQLSASSMQSFSTFEKFYVKNNEIDLFYARGLQKLEQLDLTGNNIFEIPRFCDDYTEQSLVPRLKNLILTDNAIRSLQQSSFRCLHSLSVLILDGNRMKTLGNNIFTELVNLNRLSINAIPKLKELSPLAFNISSLHILQFVQNGFKFDMANYSADIFKYLPNLRTLDLTKNHLPNDQYTLYSMFANLAELEKLILQSTHVSILPNGLFQKMPRLKFLSLAGNYIEKWEQSIFENITSLRKLYLSGNYIHIINKTSLPYSLLMSLEVFDLSNNKFWCTCAQKWFVDFLRSSNITKSVLVNWPDRYSCSYPDEWNLLSLKDYNPTDADCKVWTPLFTVLIIVSSASFLVFLVILVIFRCHANIRNAVYLLRVYNHKRKGYVRLSSSEDYQFDAFIVYCDADREWVHNVLLQRLEAIGLKVCIHHRDFDVGEPITDNIERYIEISWKIVVVMSNNFTKSEWCQWEIDLVQERRRKHGKDALVLIMYSPIDTHHMTSSIRTLLDTTPHLAYKEGFGEDLFWSATVKAVDRPLCDPPTAVF